ncbi:NAD(P)-dependent oxidoreductase [Mesorhizobium sp. 1B3]|uniref:NAD(P)-dependent oxidoreductase n=1 Tax=Mesorhizobium sp. 1B3 TaxID=3243599 RepID=UPI003D966B8B
MSGDLASSEMWKASIVIKRTQIGLLGLGIMGMAFAKNLIQNGFQVHGFDPLESARQSLTTLGGLPHESARSVFAAADLVLTALPNVSALEAAVADCLPALSPAHVVAEMSTLPVSAKEAARDQLATRDAILLDCPVSGTGSQAESADVVVYASGPAEAAARLEPAFHAISKKIHHVGQFGNGMKLKLIANLLVAIHNLATAEALNMAERSGLDLNMVYAAIASGGAATSRVFDLRAPLMIANQYEPPTMKIENFMKDVSLIMDHALALHCPVPLLSAALPYYTAAISQDRHQQDTAALYPVLKGMSDIQTV